MPALSQAQREQVVQALTRHFASDHLSLDDLEARLEKAYRVQTLAELQTLLSGLPALSEPAAATVPASAAATVPGPTVVPVTDAPQRGMIWAILGGATRRGRWAIPRELKVFAFWGGATLDLRQAEFPMGVTEIDVTAIMGGVEIFLPPGVRVESLGSAFIGGFDARGDDRAELSPNAPLLRLSGFAFMGGVDAKVKKEKRSLQKAPR